MCSLYSTNTAEGNEVIIVNHIKRREDRRDGQKGVKESRQKTEREREREEGERERERERGCGGEDIGGNLFFFLRTAS